jgi:hypothetical protein
MNYRTLFLHNVSNVSLHTESYSLMQLFTSSLLAILFLGASSGLLIAKANFHPKSSSSSVLSSRIVVETSTDDNFKSDLAFYNRLVTCNNPLIAVQINASLNVLNDALRLYGPTNVVASYNGGKDADVVMNLMRAAIAKYSSDKPNRSTAKFIYFAIKDEFPSVINHIDFQQKNLGLHMVQSPNGILQVLCVIIIICYLLCAHCCRIFYPLKSPLIVISCEGYIGIYGRAHHRAFSIRFRHAKG